MKIRRVLNLDENFIATNTNYSKIISFDYQVAANGLDYLRRYYREYVSVKAGIKNNYANLEKFI